MTERKKHRGFSHRFMATSGRPGAGSDAQFEHPTQEHDRRLTLARFPLVHHSLTCGADTLCKLRLRHPKRATETFQLPIVIRRNMRKETPGRDANREKHFL